MLTLPFPLTEAAALKAVSKARSTADAAMVKVMDALMGAKADAEAALVDAEASPEKNHLTVPINLVKSKLLFADPALNGDRASLTDLTEQVKEKKQKQPCKQWEELVTISDLQKFATSTFDKLAAEEDCGKEKIAEALKACSDKRASLQELAKSINAASKDLKAAKQQRAKLKAAPKGAGGRPPDAASGATASTPTSSKGQRAAAQAKPIFEFCTSYGTEARSFRTEAELSSAASRAGDLDFSKPWVLCGSESLLKSVSNERGVDSALSSFKSSWATSAIRASPGRGLQRLKDESTAAAARGIMAGNLSRHILPLSASAPELLASLASSIFAVAVGNEAAYVEKDAMPTLRMAAVGSRMVCLVQLGIAVNILGVDMAKPNAFMRVAQAILAATQAKINALGPDLYHFALGPGDVLYTPAGYVVAEAAGIGNGPRASGKDAGS